MGGVRVEGLQSLQGPELTYTILHEPLSTVPNVLLRSNPQKPETCLGSRV